MFFRIIYLGVFIWTIGSSASPASSREETYVPLQFLELRKPMERVLRSHNTIKQNLNFYKDGSLVADSRSQLKDFLENLPVKTTTTNAKFSSGDKDKNILESSDSSLNKNNANMADNDPVWWSEYPIPFVGTTSNSDAKWNNGAHKPISSENIGNSQRSAYENSDKNIRIENKRQVSERSFNIPSELTSVSTVVEPESSESNESDIKYTEPLALPSKQRVENPPLRRVQNIVHLSSLRPEEDIESETNNSNNPVFTSLLDMISTAEELRKKRPALHSMEMGSLMIEEPTDDKVSDTSSFNPERIKESNSEDSVVGIQEKEDWKEHLIIDWDPAKTPLTTAVLGSVMLFIILVVVVLALRVHCRNRQKLSQEWIRHPVVQPHTATSGIIQPHISTELTHQLIQSEPIRIKAKGLLERRGSNTSLTIDLPAQANFPGQESSSPTRECTPEEFLCSAGNRMSRRQLRQCLYDPRVLHAEFWQIPSNHPEKCMVPGSTDKNRYRTVLPNEDTRVILTSPEGEQRYINANYVKGYDSEDKSFIATQGPLVNTIEDMWMMVLQEKSPAVVMITRLKEKGRVKCEPYVPSYTTTYNSLQIIVKQIIQKNGYTIRQILIQRGDVQHTTLHFWFTSWPDHKVPSSARQLLSMAAQVNDARKGKGPVIVHCSAGIGRTGCFIAISNCILQLLEEDCVDILGTVCHMRLDRGGMVQTPEQYEFIHRALMLYESSLPLGVGE